MTTGPDRMPPIPQSEWTEAQRQAAAELIASPRGEVRGPFVPLLRSPEVLDRSQKLGEYLRYRSRVPQRLRELAILVIAHHWRQGYEWAMHAPLAVQAGVPVTLIESLAAGTLGTAEGHTPDADSTLIVDFCQQLLNRQDAAGRSRRRRPVRDLRLLRPAGDGHERGAHAVARRPHDALLAPAHGGRAPVADQQVAAEHAAEVGEMRDAGQHAEHAHQQFGQAVQ